jgi:hypothetical protein
LGNNDRGAEKGDLMQAANRMAFKEWAVICEALGNGRQSVIIRKGGIHEGREGFRVAHDEFWLFPTYLHQVEPENLIDEAHGLLREVLAARPPDDRVLFQYYAVVQEVHELADESSLPRLAGLHLWSERTLHERFHYRRPGLFVLPVRVYRLPAAVSLPNSPHFAGCRSWVDLPVELATAAAMPVLSEAEFSRRSMALRTALATAGQA